MKLLRIAAVGAGLAWFLDPRNGPVRRKRAVETVIELAARAGALLERGGLRLGRRSSRGEHGEEPAWTAAAGAPEQWRHGDVTPRLDLGASPEGSPTQVGERWAPVPHSNA